jgi:transposase-like protein
MNRHYKCKSCVGNFKEQLLTTQTEELISNIYKKLLQAGRRSSDQPKLYKHPDKTVCVYVLKENLSVLFSYSTLSSQ